MEIRSQDEEIAMPYSIDYNPPIRESTSGLASTIVFSGAEGSSTAVEIGIRAASLGRSQTLERCPHQQQQHGQEGDQNPNPDTVPVAAAVSDARGAPQASRSISLPPPTTAATNSTTLIESAASIRYVECLKNHAASIGGHVVDGCGEFMSSGEEGTPDALRCAACNCHRNFHRKEVEGTPDASRDPNSYHSYKRSSKNESCRTRVNPHHYLHPSRPLPPLQQHQKFFPINPSTGPVPPMMMAFGGHSGESSSEDLNVYRFNAGPPEKPQPQFAPTKKRFRTKFTHEQKDKMLEFAEKLGWKIQKQDEKEVEQFCAEVGVKRQVLRVWMHNNKHSMKKPV